MVTVAINETLLREGISHSHGPTETANQRVFSELVIICRKSVLESLTGTGLPDVTGIEFLTLPNLNRSTLYLFGFNCVWYFLNVCSIQFININKKFINTICYELYYFGFDFCSFYLAEVLNQGSLRIFGRYILSVTL